MDTFLASKWHERSTPRNEKNPPEKITHGAVKFIGALIVKMHENWQNIYRSKCSQNVNLLQAVLAKNLELLFVFSLF